MVLPMGVVLCRENGVVLFRGEGVVVSRGGVWLSGGGGGAVR